MGLEIQHLLIVGIGVLAAVCGWQIAKAFALHSGRLGKLPPLRTALLSVVFALPFLAMATLHLPLIAFYTFVWLTCVVLLFGTTRRGGHSWLMANIVAEEFMLVHLAFAALLAIITEESVGQALSGIELRCASLAASLAAVILINLLLGKTSLGAQQRTDQPAHSFHPLLLFSWFSLAFVGFDALSGDIAQGWDMLAWFTLLSALLMGVGLIAFLFSTTNLGRDARLEKEYLRLERERKSEDQRGEELSTQAYSDALTGLASRRTALKRLEELRSAGSAFCLVFIDMDGLKPINDTFGHATGDACLIRLADALRTCFDDATICRIGGDEFFAIFPTDDRDHVVAVTEQARAILAAEDEDPGPLTFSYGILDSNTPVEDASELMHRADRLMYVDKQRKRAEKRGEQT